MTKVKVYLAFIVGNLVGSTGLMWYWVQQERGRLERERKTQSDRLNRQARLHLVSDPETSELPVLSPLPNEDLPGLELTGASPIPAALVPPATNGQHRS